MNRRSVFALSALAVVLLVLPVAVVGEEPPPPMSPAAMTAATSRADAVARGEFLVRIGGCNDCHTPFHVGPNGVEPDMSRMLSGHPQELVMPPAPAPTGPWMVAVAATNTAWAGPWGVSFTRNLTPDETGLGKWTVEQFIAALKTGRHEGRGRPILPPMPWQNYGQLAEEDLRAIWAYLKTVPPVKNKVPDPLPPPAAPAS